MQIFCGNVQCKVFVAMHNAKFCGNAQCKVFVAMRNAKFLWHKKKLLASVISEKRNLCHYDTNEVKNVLRF